MQNVKTCVIGGSGAYKLLEEFKKTELPLSETPHGKTSAPISICEYQGIEFAFLQRHGKNHEYPAHKVPYTANIWALKQLGVDSILANFTCGSLQENITPNSFLIPDQFFDRTKKRQDTFFDTVLKHVGAAEPYCSNLRSVFARACDKAGAKYHDGGTVVVIEGPRFSTKAESKWFRKMGWDIVTMTQYPEVILARELGICYAAAGLVTDYDCGFEKEKAVSHEVVVDVFKQNEGVTRKIMLEAVKLVEDKRLCDCRKGV